VDENQEEREELAMQRYVNGNCSNGRRQDTGSVFHLPRVIELGDVSDRYCCNGNDA